MIYPTRRFDVAVRLGGVTPALTTSHLDHWLNGDRPAVVSSVERDEPANWDGELLVTVLAENGPGAVCTAALAVRNGLRQTGCMAQRMAVSTKG